MQSIEHQHSLKDASNCNFGHTNQHVQAFDSAPQSAINGLSVPWGRSMHRCLTGQKYPLLRHEQAGCNSQQAVRRLPHFYIELEI